MLEILASLAKALAYAAALSSAGVVVAGATLRPRTLPDRLVRGAAGLLVLLSLASAVLLVLRLGAGTDLAGLTIALANPLGAGLAMQAIGGVWLGLSGTRRGGLIGGLLILLSFAIVGHSATNGAVAATTVMVHLTAAAWWLGGLWILLTAPASEPADSYQELVRRFSVQAAWVVALLLSAALVTSALLLDFAPDFTRTYDQGLLVKGLLFAALIGLAACNRWLLAPKMASRPSRQAWLRRSILAELVLFACIMATSAWLTTWQSPHATDHHEPVERVAGPISIVDPWAPVTLTDFGTAAGYMTISNNQPHEDRLLSVSSPWAEQVTLHASRKDGNMTRMERLDGLALAPGASIVLEPGAYHLMFAGLYTPLVAGDEVPLTLEFADAGKVELTLEVRPLGAASGHAH
ncbi:MAG: copper chaperone PCu(A)C [Pseudomonadota bacterium]